MKINQYYREYLQSEEWIRARNMRKSFDNNRCRNCGTTENLQVHHKSYGILDKPDVKNEMVTLCRDCHKKITIAIRNKHNGGYCNEYDRDVSSFWW